LGPGVDEFAVGGPVTVEIHAGYDGVAPTGTTSEGTSVPIADRLALPEVFAKAGIERDDLRVYLYHFPQMSQTPLSTDLVLRLRDAFGPIIAGLKDGSGDFEQSLAFVETTGSVETDFDTHGRAGRRAHLG